MYIWGRKVDSENFDSGEYYLQSNWDFIPKKILNIHLLEYMQIKSKKLYFITCKCCMPFQVRSDMPLVYRRKRDISVIFR